MIRVHPTANTHLGHRAFHLATSERSGRIITCSHDGDATLLENDLVSRFCFRLNNPEGLAISPDGDLLALVDCRGISLCQPENGVPKTAAAGQFQSCLFRADGALLYTSSTVSRTAARIEVRDTGSLRVVATTDLPDPFGDSTFMLFPHPEPSYLIVWAAAGQDGQALFTLELAEKGLTVSGLTDLVDTTPPGFDHEGKSFLVVHEAEEVRRYSFPSGDLIGSFMWSDETDSLGERVEFSGKNRALVSTNEGRMHLIDVATFKLISEVTVPGHEPRPVPELYPALANETGLASDMSQFRPYATGSFVSVHRHLPSRNDEWSDEVIVWQSPEQ